MSAPPTGTITFLFTDIAGSSARFEQFGDAMHAAVRVHDSVLRDASSRRNGHVFKTGGDAFFIAFPTAQDAISAAFEAQITLLGCPETLTVGGISVRMALHTGQAEFRDDDYFGDTLNRTARLLNLAHGGQVLLSGPAAELAGSALPDGARLVDLGAHRLRDLQRPERIFELHHPDLPTGFPQLRSLEYLPTNLPQQLTSFIGREPEIAEVKKLLSGTRLLTLTGSGGCGKTRLALQVAAEVLDEYTDGIWLVELAALRDPELVDRTVCAALKLPEEPGQDALTTLIRHLEPRKEMLVLDNCEHLVDSVATLVENLLRACAGLRVMATSREGLGVAGETLWRVPSLSLPSKRGQESELDLDSALSYEAVRLFVDRARSLVPGFRLTPAGAASIAGICRRLDGIPLAIELSAAMVNVLSPEQISDRLVDFFKVLTRGSRTALPRQKTLLGAIQWSYDLLTEPQRMLLRRLSVFVGGWTLEAAEDVCSGDGIEPEDVLELLTALVAKSLVIVDDVSIGTRYGLLESVRQFAYDHLIGYNEAEARESSHHEYFLWLSERSHVNLQGPSEGIFLERLEREHDNFRAALMRATSVSKRLRLATGLHRFWMIRGHLSEGSSWLAGTLSRSQPTGDTIEAKANNAAGILAWLQGETALANRFLERARDIYMSTCDTRNLHGVLSNLASLKCEEREFGVARQIFEECLAYYRSMNDDQHVAVVLSNLGAIALEEGRFQDAAEVLVESVGVHRRVGNQSDLATALNNLGHAQFRSGSYLIALENHRESLRIRHGLHDDRGTVLSLSALAIVLAKCGDAKRSIRLLAASHEVCLNLGISQPRAERELFCEAIELCHGQLDSHRYNVGWEAGKKMQVEEAVSLGLLEQE